MNCNRREGESPARGSHGTQPDPPRFFGLTSSPTPPALSWQPPYARHLLGHHHASAGGRELLPSRSPTKTWLGLPRPFWKAWADQLHSCFRPQESSFASNKMLGARVRSTLKCLAFAFYSWKSSRTSRGWPVGGSDTRIHLWTRFLGRGAQGSDLQPSSHPQTRLPGYLPVSRVVKCRQDEKCKQHRVP